MNGNPFIVWCIDSPKDRACRKTTRQLIEIRNKYKLSLKIKQMESLADFVELLTSGETPDLLFLHADLMRQERSGKNKRLPVIVLHPGETLTERQLYQMIAPVCSGKDEFFAVRSLYSGKKGVQY